MLCGRAKKDGESCRNLAASKADDIRGRFVACWQHMTSDERHEHKRKKQEWNDYLEHLSSFPAVPASWRWGITASVLADGNPLAAFHEENGDACGICGGRHRRLVLDHDHNTGWERGYLCPPCNLREPSASWKAFRRWRKLPSAGRLGVWGRYIGVIRGADYGLLNGRRNAEKHAVTRDGVVMVHPGLLGSEKDPAILVAQLTENGD